MPVTVPSITRMSQMEQDVARRIHSINFYIPNGNSYTVLNSLGDFHLIPSKMPIIAPKSPEFSYVTVPGSIIGDIDMTQALTGNTLYKNREGSWEFFYETAYRFALESHGTTNLLTPFQILRLIETNLQGKTLKVALMDDPSMLYTGRVWCDGFTPGEESASSVTLKYKFKPDPETVQT